MHQQPAQGLRVGLPCFVAPGVDGFGEADFSRLCATVDEFGRVLQDKDLAFAGRYAGSSCGEMASKNAMFGDARVIKEAVGRLRRCPVTAGRGDWLARCG